MTPLALFVVLALGTHRIVRFVQRDHLTLRWREEFYNRFPPDAQRQARLAVWEPTLRDVAFKARQGAKGTTLANYGEGVVAVGVDWPPVSRLGYWLHCPWCLGAWISLFVVLVAEHWASLPLPVAWWLALSSAAALLCEMED